MEGVRRFAYSEFLNSSEGRTPDLLKEKITINSFYYCKAELALLN